MLDKTKTKQFWMESEGKKTEFKIETMLGSNFFRTQILISNKDAPVNLSL